jgi:peroxiredoxin
LNYPDAASESKKHPMQLYTPTPRRIGSWLSLATLCMLGVSSALAAAPEASPATAAREALAALGVEEAALASARLTVTVTDRRGPYVKDENLDLLRRRMEGRTPTVAEGTLTYGPNGWLKDLNVRLLRTETTTMRTRTAAAGGLLRMLLEGNEGGQQKSQARVIRAPSLVPGDAILTRQVAKSLEGVTWISAKSEGGLLTLVGSRDDEKHEVRIARQPKTWLKGWKLTRGLTAPTGERVEQTYWCEVTRGAVPEPIGYVEEWVLVPAANSVVSRVTQVRSTAGLSDLKPDETAVRFPKGTLVTDARGEVPVEYRQTEEGVNEEEVAEASRLLAQGRAKVGDPAPPFTVRGEKNRPIKSTEFKGKPLAIFWYSDRNGPGDALGAAIARVSDEYRKRGVQSLVLLGEGDTLGNWETLASDYKKDYRWNMPVGLDTEGEAMRVYGYVAAVPKVAVIDRAGKLVFVQPGFEMTAVRKALDSVAEKAEKAK